MAFINYATREVYVHLRGRTGEMEGVVSWYEDPEYENVSGDPALLPEFPQVVYERIPLNSDFVDNGVYLTYKDPNGTRTDITHLVGRYGHVNTAKAGEYVLKYFCEYKSWSRIYKYDENEPDIEYDGEIYTEPVADLRWKKSRKVIVYEPNWVMTLIPQIYQIYPFMKQVIQRYQDIYWELNYKGDNVYLGTKASRSNVPGHCKIWKLPVGHIYGHSDNDNLWYIYGHTFKDKDSVEIDLSGKNKFISSVMKDLVIFSCREEFPWDVNHRQVSENDILEDNYYRIGTWVKFLDNIYVCHKSHNTIQTKYSKIKPKTIYPTDEEYWAIGCRVELAKATHSAKDVITKKDILQRGITTAIRDMAEHDLLDKSKVKECHGYIIRSRNVKTNSQGFLYLYDYNALPLSAVTITLSSKEIVLEVQNREHYYHTVRILWESYHASRAEITSNPRDYTFAKQTSLTEIINADSVVESTVSLPYEIDLNNKNTSLIYNLSGSDNTPFIAQEWKDKINELVNDGTYQNADLLTQITFAIDEKSGNSAMDCSDETTLTIRVPKIEIEFRAKSLVVDAHVDFAYPHTAIIQEISFQWNVKNATEVGLYNGEKKEIHWDSDFNSAMPLNTNTAWYKRNVLNSYFYTFVARRKVYGLLETKTLKFTKVTKYQVIVNDGAGSGYYAQGIRVSIIADKALPCERFARWEVINPDNMPDTSVISDLMTIKQHATFEMPMYPLRISPVYETIMYTLSVREFPEACGMVKYNDMLYPHVTGTEILEKIRLTDNIACGTSLTLTAIVTDSDYGFRGWMLDDIIVSYEKTYELEGVDRDYSLIAVFVKNPWTARFLGFRDVLIATYKIERGDSIAAPNPPKVLGRSFAGWDKALNEITQDMLDTDPETGESLPILTIRAIYKRNTYTVIFRDFNKGQIGDVQTVLYGDAAIPPNIEDVPLFSGAEFIAWNTDAYQQVMENLIIDAQYKMNRYILTYLSHGTTTYRIEQIAHGNGITRPDDPFRSGYKFVAWYADPEFASEFDFDNVIVMENTTIYAKWNTIAYLITYNLNGGDVDGNNPAEYTIENEDFKLISPTKSECGFSGWAGTGIKDVSKNVVIKKGSIGDREYTAKWAAAEYIVRFFNYNDTLLKSVLVKHGSATIPPSLPTRENYTFVGWDTDAYLIVTDNLTVTAVYEINTFTVTYLCENGELWHTEKVAYGETANPPEAPEKQGYTFKWNGQYTNIKRNITLVMVYEIITYTIKYELDGGELLSTQDNPTSYTVETLDFTLNNPEKENYEFLGWIEDSSGCPKDNIVIAKGNTGNKVFLAVWVGAMYGITYSSNIEVEDSGNPTRYSMEMEEAIILIAPKKNGYKFLGWTGSNGNTPQLSVTIPAGSTGNRHYNMNWEIITYQITYHLDGGSTDNPTDYTIEDEVTLNNPTRDGYTFKDWFDNSKFEGDPVTLIPMESTEDKEFWAEWTINKYIIEFVDWNNVVLDQDLIVTHGNIMQTGDNRIPSVPPREYHNFIGWTPELPHTIKGDTTFIAQYEIWRYALTVDILPDGDNTPSAGQIDITAQEAGAVDDAGRYAHGSSIVIKAIPNTEDNYVFVEWRKGDSQVFTESTYGFTITENTDLIAVFRQEE